MQALMNVSRTSVTLALPHSKSAAVGRAAALAVGGALGCRSLFVSARYNGGGGVNGVAASMNLDASRDAAIRAYSITPDTGAAIPGRLHDQVSERLLHASFPSRKQKNDELLNQLR